MTSAEARHAAEALLADLTDLTERLNNVHHRVLLELNDLLDEIVASKAGLCAIDQPINVAWSLIDVSLLELMRTEFLPRKANTIPSSMAHIKAKFSNGAIYGEGNDSRSE